MNFYADCTHINLTLTIMKNGSMHTTPSQNTSHSTTQYEPTNTSHFTTLNTLRNVTPRRIHFTNVTLSMLLRV